MVVMNDGVKESSLKRSKQQDFPTPESPISSSLIYTGEQVSTRRCDGHAEWPQQLLSRARWKLQTCAGFRGSVVAADSKMRRAESES